ncbi:MAG: 16S rRNA (guanine(966)-N(2))-methyltransferase RsmD [Thermodesulfovibrionales bacterium]|nr:16S rRNA (guanine(966)-N(2))-methyltransferase RsmD [Thermodesulfovibrionales bacterium]
MRISGGSAKGRKVGLKRAFIQKEEGDELRPTSAKVRQAIFNIIGNEIIDSSFLDLYAGTGAVGIEALSRGAFRVVFVDDNEMRVNIIKDIIERFGFKDRAVTIKDSAYNFMQKFSTPNFFDILFLDPPYASDECDIIFPLVDNMNILRDNGLVIAEHASRNMLPDKVGNLKKVKTYRYGDTSLTLYKKRAKD